MGKVIKAKYIYRDSFNIANICTSNIVQKIYEHFQTRQSKQRLFEKKMFFLIN